MCYHSCSKVHTMHYVSSVASDNNEKDCVNACPKKQTANVSSSENLLLNMTKIINTTMFSIHPQRVLF